MAAFFPKSTSLVHRSATKCSPSPNFTGQPSITSARFASVAEARTIGAHDPSRPIAKFYDATRPHG